MRRAFGVVAVLAVATIPAPLLGQDTEWNRYTLEELSGVHVRAEADDVCRSHGVSTEAMTSSAEETLTAAEIPVLTETAMLEAPGLPELRISLGCAQTEGAVGFAVGLRVQQAAQMVRDNQITLSEAVTWYSEAVGVVPGDDIGSAVQEALNEKLEAFTAAFTAANATEESTANPSGSRP